MSAIKTTPARAIAGTAIFASPAGRVIRAIAATWTIMVNRRQIRALGDLDDYMLADIGLTRADLREAYEAPLLVDPSLRLAAVVGQQYRSTPPARPHGRRGDAAAPSDAIPRRAP